LKSPKPCVKFKGVWKSIAKRVTIENEIERMLTKSIEIEFRESLK